MINEDKTKYMASVDEGFRENRKISVKTESAKMYDFEEVDKSKYLGTVFYRKSDIKGEIRQRLMAGNRCIGSLNRILRSKTISRNLKVRIYRTVIRPIVIYGSEVWTMKAEEQKMLGVWERKVLRKIFGGKKVGEKIQHGINAVI